MKKIIKYTLAIGVVFSVIGIIYISTLISNLPDVNQLKEYRPPIPSKILSRNNEVLLKIGLEERELVQVKDIPKTIINSFLAAEDDNFYNHNGIDLMGFLRAAVANLKAGGWVQGGSTITQQVAKKLLLTSDKTIERKLKDMILAMIIERHYSKDEILYLYLNQVYLGGGYYGIKSAFKGYFGKELKDVTHAEAALITGLLVAPTKYSPYVNPKYSKIRQIYVLDRLLKTQKITEDEYKTAVIEKIKLKKKLPNTIRAPYFADWVRQLVEEKVGKENFLKDGFVVKTTVDLKLQEIAEQKVKIGARNLDKRQGFKGPINKIDEGNILKFALEQRENLNQENSEHIWFDPEGKLVDEFELSDEDKQVALLEMESRFDEFKQTKKEAPYLDFPDEKTDSEYIKKLEEDKDYKAVVLGTNDSKKIIYINIAGVIGIIPKMHFGWAHERSITDEIQYFPLVNYPSRIVKKGDVINVQLAESERKSLWRYIDLNYKKNITNKDKKRDLRKQKFYVFKLEQKPEAQVALISVDPHSGDILAMVGGVSFSESQFNRVLQSKRQPGSSFKPIIYAVALENGFSPASLLVDTPQALKGVDESLNWKPKNYDGKFKGMLTFRRALEESRNIPTILLLQEIGVDKIVEFLKRNQIDVEVPQDLSISLGSFGINLMQMVSLYSVFPSGGKRFIPEFITSITNRDGKEFFVENPFKPQEEETKTELAESEELKEETIEEVVNESEKDLNQALKQPIEKQVVKFDFKKNLSEKQVYDHRLAFIMTNLLKGVVQNGTGRKAKDVSSFIGGKTGTTNNYVDSWFVGFSQNTVTGVWVGLDDNTTMGGGETGSKAALPVWKDYMKEALKHRGEYDFKVPRGIINVAINPQEGTLANPTDPTYFREYFVEGTEPGGKFDLSKNTEELGLLEDDDYYSQQ